MKKICKTTGILLIIIIVMAAQCITVFAYDRVAYLDKKEMFNKVWEQYYNDNFAMFESEPSEILDFQISQAHGELQHFIDNYEILNNDITTKDVSNDYAEYIYNNILNGRTVLDDADDGTIIQSNENNPNDKLVWKYNEKDNKYICYDSNDKILNSYTRYGKRSSSPSGGSSHKSQRSTIPIEQKKIKAESVEKITESVTALTATEDTVNVNKSGFSYVQITILTVIGLSILAGVIILSFMSSKKRWKG